jgi:hypothetical protein
VISFNPQSPTSTPWLSSKQEPKAEHKDIAKYQAPATPPSGASGAKGSTGPDPIIKKEPTSPYSPHKFGVLKSKEFRDQKTNAKGRQKLTRGADKRHRAAPSTKRDAIDRLREEQKKSGTGKIDGLTVFEYVSKMLKVPISNLRAWDKDCTRIYKLAGDIEASMIMGVKSRRLAAQVKNMFKGNDKSMKPLTAFLQKDI